MNWLFSNDSKPKGAAHLLSENDIFHENTPLIKVVLTRKGEKTQNRYNPFIFSPVHIRLNPLLDILISGKGSMWLANSAIEQNRLAIGNLNREPN